MARLVRPEMEEWGPGLPDFVEFWRFLNNLADVPDDKCCRSGKCGAPNCAIRNCAKSREIEVCALCAEYPCEKIETFAQSEPLWDVVAGFDGVAVCPALDGCGEYLTVGRVPVPGKQSAAQR